jgi:hypothetical protein
MLSLRPYHALTLIFVAGITIITPNLAHGGELQVDTGLALRKTTWRDDWSGGFQLGFGYRFARVVGLDFRVWEEMASVDTRLNTGLTIGITGTWPLPTLRPTARVYFIHQHEEGWVSVADHPWGTIAGIGTGIRHRAGAGLRLGVEVPFSKRKKVEWVGIFGVDTTWFPDTSLGPSIYAGLSAGIGLNYAIEELP